MTPPFITLENMVRDSRDSRQRASKGLHVISLAENKLLKFGRGHDSDIRVPDVSVSRFHASVRFQNGQFLLEDNNSKYGTVVAMRKPQPLEPGSSLSIQVGRSVISISLQTATDSSTYSASEYSA
jgi:pSer/pThr/pTyr-binding forkhead associated (FHA) protein